MKSKILQFTKAMWKWALCGFRISKLEEQRMNICYSCPYYDKYKCTKCGCYLLIKTKMVTESCPINKW